MSRTMPRIKATARPATTIAIAALWLIPVPGSADDDDSAPLLQQDDLVYVGAFRLPPGGRKEATFEYGGRAIAFNPENGSLFIVGHDHRQRTAEVAIPDNLVISDNYDELPVASVLQPFEDATDGKLRDINPGDPNDQRIGGHLVYNGKLYVSAYSYYDGAGTQRATHFVSPLDLRSSELTEGPFAVGRDVHFTGGYMTLVPPEWRDRLGGPALTGNCCRAIISQQSHGPAISVFDPETIKDKRPDVTELIGYPKRSPLGPGGKTQNEYFNLATKVEGIVFPHNTRSVLFIGYHGIGPYCYGGGTECNDPAKGDQGTHAYPYVYQVWAYDANDLHRVKRKKLRPHRVEPYGIWRLSLPFERVDGQHQVGGAAYDPATDRIYISQRKVNGPMPIIHAFGIRRDE